MNNVVYILGAGFSAGLGLPLVSNFLDKSRELYAEDRKKYDHFREVFTTIRKMGYLKSYFNVDLENIEEVLSILQMDDHLGDGKERHQFERMICDVINYYTPAIPRLDRVYPSAVFTGHVEWQRYLCFVANLFNLRFTWEGKDQISPGHPPRRPGAVEEVSQSKSSIDYSVISLNYDRILELGLQFIKENFSVKLPLEFVLDTSDSPTKVALAKLHGCVSTGKIMPPTWNKYLNPVCLSAWKLAYSLLARANHVRIIGYSLPTSEAYVRYLLKAALNNTEHLKTIDVVCLDNGGVRETYGSFIIHPKRYRFASGSVRRLFDILYQHSNARETNVSYFNCLEDAHVRFMTDLVKADADL